MMRGGSLSSLSVGDYYKDSAYMEGAGQPAAQQQSNAGTSVGIDDPRTVVTAMLLTLGILVAIRVLYEAAEAS
jgi:hypothetical protein